MDQAASALKQHRPPCVINLLPPASVPPSPPPSSVCMRCGTTRRGVKTDPSERCCWSRAWILIAPAHEDGEPPQESQTRMTWSSIKKPCTGSQFVCFTGDSPTCPCFNLVSFLFRCSDTTCLLPATLSLAACGARYICSWLNMTHIFQVYIITRDF